MFERNLANKLKGWNTISDICEKLNIRRSSAYLYVHKLNKKGFVIQKIKKPRGTMYLIDSIPKPLEKDGMLDDTEIMSSELEYSKNEIQPEHKISFLLKESNEKNNIRFRKEAKKLLRSIKNWKRLYRYLKAYDVIDEFREIYKESLGKIKKLPSIPKRYKKLIGV
ncbi:MAG: hypothetical protein GF368_02735 [Candidatus Aenigmarchaeota archaeon]|nr:hypothetical protein [Candidatus Aenigmarchaeota archaeon]